MIDFNAELNALVDKAIAAALATDQVLDDAAIALIKADAAAALKAALDADAAQDAAVLKAKDDEIAALNARIADLEAAQPSAEIPSLSIGDITATEISGLASFKVSLTEAHDRQIKVDFKTVDGTAKAGEDYVAESGSITFAPGQITRDIYITITDDKLVESNEAFTVEISNPRIAPAITRPAGTATIVSDDTTPTPTPTPAGYPDASNTGFKGTLTTYSGPTNIGAGTVIENKRILADSLIVRGAGVVIRNCEMIFGGYFGIDAEGATGMVVEDSTITGKGLAHQNGAILTGKDAKIRRNNISAFENGIVLQNGAHVVEGNYVHDLKAGSAGHYDCISVQGGQSNTLIKHNTLVGYDTGAVFIKCDFGPIANTTVEDNLCKNQAANKQFSVPMYSIAGPVGGTPTGTRFINNRMERGFYGYWSIDGSVVRTGNVDASSGANIDRV